MYIFHDLKPVMLNDCEKIVRPAIAEIYDLDTPALHVLTDFLQTQPLMLEQQVGLEEAVTVMRKTHVRSVIVTDDKETFLGLLTLADLESRKVLSIASSMGTERANLSIRDIMTPREALCGVAYKEICRSRIGDLLNTLEHQGKQHMLVVDTEKQQIRGLISASDLARRLKIPINVTNKVTTFNDILSVVTRNSDV